MCGLGNFIRLLIYLFVFAPVLFYAIYKGGLLFSERRFPSASRLVRGLVCGAISVVLTSATIFSMEANTERNYETMQPNHEAELVAARQERSTEFWRDFGLLEGDLYKAKADSAPAVQNLLKILKDRELAHVKIGPVHSDGRRELAFDGADQELIESMPQSLSHHWYTGRGFVRGWQRLNYLWVRKKGDCEVADDAEYCIAAHRNGQLVDVDMYCDFPVGDGIYQYSEECFVKNLIGQEAYDRYLGQITVHSRKDEPVSAKSGNDLIKAFTSQLTQDEQISLVATITDRPCVVMISTGPWTQQTGIQSARSPYLKLRRADTLQTDDRFR